jgi:hypothetical protein
MNKKKSIQINNTGEKEKQKGILYSQNRKYNTGQMRARYILF